MSAGDEEGPHGVCDQGHPDHRHGHPRRRAVRPVDVAAVLEVGRPGARRCAGTTRPRRRRGSSATSGSSAVGRLGHGRLARSTRRTTRATLERRRPGDVGRGDPAGADGRVRHRGPDPLSQRRRCSTPGSVMGLERPRAAARRRPGLQRLADRLEQRRAGPLHPGDVAAVLGPRRHAGRDRPAAPRRATSGIIFTQDPMYFGLPGLDRPALGPDVGARARSRACRSTSTSPRATTACSSTAAIPTTASTPTTRRWASRSSWATPAPSPS